MRQKKRTKRQTYNTYIPIYIHVCVLQQDNVRAFVDLASTYIILYCIHAFSRIIMATSFWYFFNRKIIIISRYLCILVHDADDIKTDLSIIFRRRLYILQYIEVYILYYNIYVNRLYYTYVYNIYIVIIIPAFNYIICSASFQITKQICKDVFLYDIFRFVDFLKKKLIIIIIL